MKKSKKIVKTTLVVLFAVGVFSLTGCGRTNDDSEQADAAVQYEILEEQHESSEEQTETDITQTQDAAQEQDAETGSSMRAYSDKEIDRMAELQQSYLDGSASPEKQILEVENAETVVAGVLCYIKDTGGYCLPDRELTDEELLEIIEHGYQKNVALNGKTQEQMDAEDLAERAMLEEKVRAAGGISEKEAIGIAKEAMETDIGERSEKMELHIESVYGWSSFLWDITNWKEYKDRGKIAYFFQFDDTEDGWYSYHCVVNAVDGSILDAYGLTLAYDSADTSIVYYEH